MITDRRRREIADSLRRLAANYIVAMAEIDETLSVLCRQLDLEDISLSRPARVHRSFDAPQDHRPSDIVVDRATFTVCWRGKTCFLGHTLPFLLFERLSRRPNQYVSYGQLFDEVWEGQVTREAVRSVVKILRQKLTRAGMRVLAQAVNGRTSEHYAFVW